MLSDNKTICVMGMFRSGTNFFRSVIELNYHADVIYNTYGWKHGFYPVVSSDSGFKVNEFNVFMTKDPYNQAFSILRYYKQNKRNIRTLSNSGDIMRSPFVIFDGLQRHGVELRFSNLIDYYNSINWNYITAAKSREGNTHIRYEFLSSNPNVVLERIQKLFNIRRKPGVLTITDNVLKNMNDKQESRDPDNASSYDRGKKFHPLDRGEVFSYLGEANVNFINENVDRDLVRRLGYNIIEWKNAH
ncbi:MAG: hypothetical protein KDK27_15270 [Leptospiraceae bacterium]|nr:hypothetical protein [Leptospiraceae bacterium]